jgi:hypothetical protein
LHTRNGNQEVQLKEAIQEEHDHAIEVMEGIQNNIHDQILLTNGQHGIGHVEANHVQIVNQHVHRDNTINKLEVFDGSSVQG